MSTIYCVFHVLFNQYIVPSSLLTILVIISITFAIFLIYFQIFCFYAVILFQSNLFLFLGLFSNYSQNTIVESIKNSIFLCLFFLHNIVSF